MNGGNEERGIAEVSERFGLANLSVFERGWLSSNNVLFHAEEDGDATLVDSGYWSHQEQTVTLVQRALGSQDRLARILNTHLHSDHCGGNARLQEKFGCRVYVPSGEFQKVVRWAEDELTYRATGQHCPRFVAQGSLSSGDSVDLGGRTWEVVAAPGHDPESVMFYDPSLQLLISADALWEDGFGVVFPELEGFEAFADVRHTLDLIARLKVEIVIPGHGRPFIDVRSALDRAYSRLDRFVADPRKHALHAAKVLIKFHLLEIHAQTLDDLDTWLLKTPYFRSVHEEHFDQRSWMEWRTELLMSLERSRAIERSGGLIKNL